jgi:hypothetical protein
MSDPVTCSIVARWGRHGVSSSTGCRPTMRRFSCACATGWMAIGSAVTSYTQQPSRPEADHPLEVALRGRFWPLERCLSHSVRQGRIQRSARAAVRLDQPCRLSISHTPLDLVVRSKLIDIVEVSLSPIRRKNVVQTLSQNRKSRFERLSVSEANSFTTKSDGM